MRLYTRTGDKGETGTLGGQRVSKADPIIAAVGDLDELNCALGWARTLGLTPEVESLLARLQSALFDAGAEASSKGSYPGEFSQLILDLEEDMDRQAQALPALKNFVLPGGTPAAASLHLCRAVCRRAERSLAVLAHETSLSPELLMLVNRISDWLFSAARWENLQAGVADIPWVKQ